MRKNKGNAKRILALTLAFALVLGNVGVSFADEISGEERIEALAEAQEEAQVAEDAKGAEGAQVVEDAEEVPGEKIEAGEGEKKETEAEKKDAEQEEATVDEKRDAEEKEATTDEKKEEKASSGERSFSTEVNGTTITMSGPETAFPEGEEYEISVEELSVEALVDVEKALYKVEQVEEKKIETYRAYDIKLVVDGKAVQPEGDVKVSFEGGEVKEQVEGKKESNVEVYYVNEDAQKATLVKSDVETAVGNEVVEMTTDHFSTYVITTTDTNGVRIFVEHYLMVGSAPDDNQDYKIYQDTQGDDKDPSTGQYLGQLVKANQQLESLAKASNYDEVEVYKLKQSNGKWVIDGNPISGNQVLTADQRYRVYYRETKQNEEYPVQMFDYDVAPSPYTSGTLTSKGFWVNPNDRTDVSENWKSGYTYVEGVVYGINSAANYPDSSTNSTRLAMGGTSGDSSSVNIGVGKTNGNDDKSKGLYNARISQPAIDENGNAIPDGSNGGVSEKSDGYINAYMYTQDLSGWGIGYKGVITKGIISGVNDDGSLKFGGVDENGNARSNGNLYEPGFFTTTPKLGKTILNNYTLGFERYGDTYTLKKVFDGNKNEVATIIPESKGHDLPATGVDFFPLDNLGTSQDKANNKNSYTTKVHNDYFGMRYDIYFSIGDYIGDMKYHFSGDDDCWVVLDNDHVILDCGGLHQPAELTSDMWPFLLKSIGVDLNTFARQVDSTKDYKDLTDMQKHLAVEKACATLTKAQKEQEHKVTVLWMERGGTDSNCYMEYVIPNSRIVDSNDEPIDVELEKVDIDANNVTLKEAEFELYTLSGSLLKSGIKSDKNGVIKVENLYLGKYILKETKAPDGYKLPSNVTYRIEITGGNTAASKSYKVYEVRKLPGDITVEKELKKNNGDKYIKLENTPKVENGFKIDKTIDKTNVENEFEITLKIQPTIIWPKLERITEESIEEVILQSKFWLHNSKNEEMNDATGVYYVDDVDVVLQNLKSQSTTSRLCDSLEEAKDAKNTSMNNTGSDNSIREVNKLIIKSPDSSIKDFEYTFDKSKYFMLEQNSVNSFTVILVPEKGEGHFLKITGVSFQNGVLTLPKESYSYIEKYIKSYIDTYNDVGNWDEAELYLPDYVVDPMGNHIDFLDFTSIDKTTVSGNPVSSTTSTAQYYESTTSPSDKPYSIIWNDFKQPTLDSSKGYTREVGDDGNIYYYYNDDCFKLKYKVRVKVLDNGFVPVTPGTETTLEPDKHFFIDDSTNDKLLNQLDSNKRTYLVKNNEKTDFPIPEAYGYLGTLKIHKIDNSTSAAAVVGAKFELMCSQTADENPVAYWMTHEKKSDGTTETIVEKPIEKTTDSNGDITYDKLPWGTYTLHEASAPAKYKTVSDITVTVAKGKIDISPTSNGEYTYQWDSTNNVGKIQIVDPLIASLDLKKVDFTQGTSLTGAKFELKIKEGSGTSATYVAYTYNGTAYNAVEVKNGTNEIEFVECLIDGEYQLTETVAPPGYALMTQPITFKIQDGKLVYTDTDMCVNDSDTSMDRLKVKNHLLYSLPSTGGIGVFVPTFVGALMMAFALFLGDKRRMKRAVVRTK